MSDMSPPVARIGWAGPRPLRAGEMLVGRRADIDNAVSICQTADILRITAESGAGKTSFLQAGLLPALERLGARILPAGERPSWVEVVEAGTDADARYLAALGADPDADLGTVLGEAVAQEIDGTPGTAPVVLLDQFEELLRFSRQAGEELLAHVARTAHRTGVTHIIVARSEYLDQLRPLDVHGRPYQLSLLPVTDGRALRTLVTAPVEAVEGLTITDDATDALVGLWQRAADFAAARGRGHGTPSGAAADLLSGSGDLGLLHMQALLWRFQRWLVDDAPEASALDRRTVTVFVTELTGRDGGELIDGEDPMDAASVLGAALRSYVERTVDGFGASLAGREEAPNHLWPLGPSTMLARVASQLVSAGYKVPQARSSLLLGAIGDDLTREDVRDLRQLGGIGSNEFGDRLAPAGPALRWEHGEPDIPPTATSTFDVAQVMVDCLDGALGAAASPEANLLRAYPRSGGDTVYELVHDGVGRALEEWADRLLLKEPHALLGAVTARAGQPVSLELDGAVLDERVHGLPNVTVGEADRLTVEHLRWIGCVIRGVTFRHLHLVGCEFTGSWFENCTFEDVVFEDALLNGAGLLGCTFTDVTFTGDHLQADGVTVLAPTADDAGVTLNGLQVNTGLFLRHASGGPWRLTNCRFQHMAFAAADVGAALEVDAATTIRHLTLDAAGPLDLKIADGARLDHVTGNAAPQVSAG